jgi:predicted metalloprotease
MTFNDNADFKGGRVQRRGGGRGRGTGLALGGGGIGVIALFVISQLLGVDLTGLAGGAGVAGTTGDYSADEGTSLAYCDTGEEANTIIDCRMEGAAESLDAFWVANGPAVGAQYTQPAFALFDRAVGTGCGDATSATGPFYCPNDQTVYVDTSFFQELSTTYGASSGSLAQLYVVAHEFGHHIQNLNGSFASADRSDTGTGSDTIRLEVQADCFAGAWVAGASSTLDAQGDPFLLEPTRTEVQDALSAASAVGDDRIQQSAGVEVQPETWTHGSSEQRTRWFETGYQGGVTACDTFAVSATEL